MRILMNTIFTAVNISLAVFFAYNVITSFIGFFKTKKLPESKKYHKFAAVVAARNEEAMLPYLFDSINNQNYPKDLIDIILIADNCTDLTAQMGRQYGATVIERHDLSKIGKGFALKYAFDRLDLKNYDALCLFDADNVVHPDFFEHMNRAYSSGARAAQGYRQMKNASDTWVSGSHSLFFWMQNRFFNRSRNVMGLSATINGTGFMISADEVIRKGWNTHTITEDIEITVKTILEQNQVFWVPESIVYDEQPLSFSQSWCQRKRWTLGIFQCLHRYGWQLVKKLFTTGRLQYFDTLMFLLAMPLTIVGTLWAVWTSFYDLILAQDYISYIVWRLLNYLAVVAASVIVVRLENKSQYKGLVKSILLYPFFLLTWPVLNCVALFSNKTVWKPIQHVRAISIEDLIEDYDRCRDEAEKKPAV